jgi:hypothetical protein
MCWSMAAVWGAETVNRDPDEFYEARLANVLLMTSGLNGTNEHDGQEFTTLILLS